MPATGIAIGHRKGETNVSAFARDRNHLTDDATQRYLSLFLARTETNGTVLMF